MSIDLRYLAGFFDGEGYVKWAEYKSSNSKGIRITIGQKKRFILDMIKNKCIELGCDNPCIYYAKNRGYGGYILNIQNKHDGKIFLNAILPYSIVKKSEIESALQSIETSFKRIRGLDLPKETIILRYNKGESCKEISETFNCHDGTIRDLLIKNGVKLRSNKESLIIKYRRLGFKTKGLDDICPSCGGHKRKYSYLCNKCSHKIRKGRKGSIRPYRKEDLDAIRNMSKVRKTKETKGL